MKSRVGCRNTRSWSAFAPRSPTPRSDGLDWLNVERREEDDRGGNAGMLALIVVVCITAATLKFCLPVSRVRIEGHAHLPAGVLVGLCAKDSGQYRDLCFSCRGLQVQTNEQVLWPIGRPVTHATRTDVSSNA
jgi:hypothetical protein